MDESVTSAVCGKHIEEHETRDEVTEIHEVTLKFNSKQLKSQIPHFQMLLHGDNPANRGLLLENLLGIIPEAKPSSTNEPFVDNRSDIFSYKTKIIQKVFSTRQN